MAGSAGPAGPPGPRGEKGEKGDAGAPAPASFRVVQGSGDSVTCNADEELVSLVCNEGSPSGRLDRRRGDRALPAQVMGRCKRQRGDE